MNKHGFTLVELLAVITLVAILSGIAIPNIISSVNNSKKNTFLLDAKRMVSKAEYLIAVKKADRDAAVVGKIYTLSDLNEKGEFSLDADGGSFDSSSFVKVTRNGNEYQYCICVIGSKRRISSGDTCSPNTGNGCISSTTLTGIDKVNDK